MARSKDIRVARVLARHKKMKAEKQNWLNLYQLCAEYVMTRKQGFTATPVNGEIQTGHLFDDTAPYANTIMAASLIGALWPNGAKSFRISMPFGMEEELDGDTEEIKQYYQFVTRRMAEFMDNPKSGFITALEEYMLDQGAFGISGIMVEDQEDDFEVPLTYRAVDAKALYIAEGANGFVNTIYIEMEYTLRQLVEKYGFDNLSAKRQAEFMKPDGCDTDKITVLQAIEPRLEKDPFAYGVSGYPYSSVHIDVAEKSTIKESGFLELPIAVTRFWKAMGEVYGRCPAMNALPSILEANALGEAWILAVEKTLDPTLLVMDDSVVGSGTIDTSPGGIIVYSVSGRVGQTAGNKPVEPLFMVGDLQWTAARRTEIGEIIKSHFYQDRLNDFNSDQRMQNPEVVIRERMRGQSLNTVYSRQLGEQLVPTIESTFNKLRRRGLLGVIPGSPEEEKLLSQGIVPKYIPDPVAHRMATGQDVYRIEFISPAARIMQDEELQGIKNLMSTTIAASQVNPGLLDIVDWDWTLRRVQELEGAPRETVLSMEKLRTLRRQKQAAQQQMMEMEAARADSETARNMGQAVQSVSQAG